MGPAQSTYLKQAKKTEKKTKKSIFLRQPRLASREVMAYMNWGYEKFDASSGDLRHQKYDYILMRFKYYPRVAQLQSKKKTKKNRKIDLFAATKAGEPLGY